MDQDGCLKGTIIRSPLCLMFTAKAIITCSVVVEEVLTGRKTWFSCSQRLKGDSPFILKPDSSEQATSSSTITPQTSPQVSPRMMQRRPRNSLQRSVSLPASSDVAGDMSASIKNSETCERVARIVSHIVSITEQARQAQSSSSAHASLGRLIYCAFYL